MLSFMPAFSLSSFLVMGTPQQRRELFTEVPGIHMKTSEWGQGQKGFWEQTDLELDFRGGAVSQSPL